MARYGKVCPEVSKKKGPSASAPGLNPLLHKTMLPSNTAVTLLGTGNKLQKWIPMSQIIMEKT